MAGTSAILYVGTYTHHEPHKRGKADGIGVYELDLESGATAHLQTVPEVPSPSFLARDPKGRALYAVTEETDPEGRGGGGVRAFAIAADGRLTPLGEARPSHGADPCYVTCDREGRHVLVANYTSGGVAMYPIAADGSLGVASAVVQHLGSSVNPRRQTSPHAHAIRLDPTGRYAFVPDLGADSLVSYRYEPERGALVPYGATPAAAPGLGPRHLEWHPDGKTLYLLNEIGSSVTTFAYDAESGALTEGATLPTLPADFAGTNSCADIHVNPSGRFVYCSNRGHDSIAVFAVDAATGALTAQGHQSTGGQTPRNFTLDAAGRLLLAANQRGDSIVAFAIDGSTGALTPTGSVTQTLSPVCLLIAPR